MLPLASRNANVTPVVPIGNSALISTEAPAARGTSLIGAGSAASTADPPATNAASADAAAPRAPPASVTATVIATGPVTAGGVVSCTVTPNEPADVFPLPSDAPQLT